MDHPEELNFVSHGVTVRGSARGRRGPLTCQQSKEAALMRRLGACQKCKLRKVKVSVVKKSLFSGVNVRTVQSTPP